MKKLLTAIFTLLIVLSSMNMAFADVDSALKAIVVSDLHITARNAIVSIKDNNSMPEYPMYSHVVSNGLLWGESETILESFLELAAAGDEEFILVPGDLANGGVAMGHGAVKALFERFETDTGKQIYVINGNHDCSNGYTKAQFEQTYQNFGFSQSLARHSESLSYTAELNGEYRLLAIDSCEENKSGGELSESLIGWIEQQANAAASDGKHLVAIMHHNLLRHMDGIGVDIAERFMDDRLANADDVWEKLADLKIKYIFTGHAHANDISLKTSDSGNEIYDVETSALSAYPCAYRTVSFSDASVDIKTDFIKDIDTARLPSGYTREQLDFIEDDFLLYAKTTLEVSSNYMLRSYLLDSARGLSKLNVDPNSDIGKFLAQIMPQFYHTLCLPLYKTEATQGRSIEEIAAKYSYALPRSEYTDAFNAVGQLLSAHVMGDENFPADSLEVRLTLDCLKVAALDVLNGLELPLDKVISGSTATLKFTRLKDCVSKAVFRESVVTKVLNAVFAPIIEGVSTDAIAPSDLNVTLPSYILQSTAKEAGFLKFLRNLIEYLINIFRAIFQ